MQLSLPTPAYFIPRLPNLHQDRTWSIFLDMPKTLFLIPMLPFAQIKYISLSKGPTPNIIFLWPCRVHPTKLVHNKYLLGIILSELAIVHRKTRGVVRVLWIERHVFSLGTRKERMFQNENAFFKKLVQILFCSCVTDIPEMILLEYCSSLWFLLHQESTLMSFSIEQSFLPGRPCLISIVLLEFSIFA